MNKYVITIIILFMLSYSTTAYTTTGLISYWNWSNNGFNDTNNNNNLTLGKGSINVINNGSCYNSKPCLNITSGTWSYVNKSNAVYPTGNNNFSWSCWEKPTSIVGLPIDMAFGNGYNGIPAKTVYGAINSSGNYCVGNTIASYCSAYQMSTTSWQFITINYDNNTNIISFYVNSTYNSNVTLTGGTTGLLSGGRIVIGADEMTPGGWSTEYYKGFIGECYLYNKTLTSKEISDLYLGITPNISITFPTSSDQHFNNNTITIQSNFNNNYTSLFWNNGSDNITTNMNVYNDSINNITYMNITGWTWNEGNNNITIYANITGNVLNAKTNFTIDTINPQVTGTFYKNNMILLNDQINGSFTFSDTYLYSINITIDNSLIIYNITNINTTSQQVNFSISSTLLSAGIHKLNLTVSDSHTALSIPKYDVQQKSENALTFNTENNVISIKTQDTKDALTYEKQVDRYNFILEPQDTTSDTITFIIDTQNDINIIDKPNSPYKKWIVSGNNWIDFINNEYDLNSIDITKTSNKQAIITLQKINKNEEITKPVIFQSIGGLNINYLNFTFYTINNTVTYTNPVGEGTITPIMLNMNITDTGLNYNDINATFTYNGTIQALTKTSDTTRVTFTSNVLTPIVTYPSQNVSMKWNLTITNNMTSVQNFNQTVQSVGINFSCTGNGVALNFTCYQEENLTKIGNCQLNINVEALNTNGQVIKVFGNNFSGSNDYTVCINPPSINYTINAKMQYGDGIIYSIRNYYLLNYILTNITQKVSLYSLTDSATNNIVHTVFNKNTGEKIVGAYVKILRYYPALNNGSDAGYRTVEVERTDVNGQILAKMILGDAWYKYIVEYPIDTIVLSTEVETILSLTKNLPVTLGIGNLVKWNNIRQLSGDVSFDEPTKTFIFTWNNKLNTDVIGNLKVYQDTGFTKILVYDYSLTTSAGTIAYQLTMDTTGKKYLAQGWITQ